MKPTTKQLRILVRCIGAGEAIDDGVRPHPDMQACLDARWIVRDAFMTRSGRAASRWGTTQRGVEECRRAGLVDSCGRLTVRGLELFKNCDREPVLDR